MVAPVYPSTRSTKWSQAPTFAGASMSARPPRTSTEVLTICKMEYWCNPALGPSCQHAAPTRCCRITHTSCQACLGKGRSRPRDLDVRFMFAEAQSSVYCMIVAFKSTRRASAPPWAGQGSSRVSVAWPDGHACLQGTRSGRTACRYTARCCTPAAS